MNRMMKKTTSLFPFALAVLLAFFWSGCGDSENSLSLFDDYSKLGPEIDEDDDPDEEDDVSSSSSKKKASSSSKKTTASSSSTKSSSSKKSSSSSSKKISSSSKEKSSSSQKAVDIYSVLLKNVKTAENSITVTLPGKDGDKKWFSTVITNGAGSASYDDEGNFVLVCLPDGFECFAESDDDNLGGQTFDDFINSNDEDGDDGEDSHGGSSGGGDGNDVDTYLSFTTSKDGDVNHGSYNLIFKFWSIHLHKWYWIRFVFSGEDFEDTKAGHGKEVIENTTSIKCGDGTKNFDVYIRDNVVPPEIVVVTGTSIKSGTNRLNITEYLRFFDKYCGGQVNSVDEVYSKEDTLEETGIGVILQQDDEYEDDGDAASVAVWDIDYDVPDRKKGKSSSSSRPRSSSSSSSYHETWNTVKTDTLVAADMYKFEIVLPDSSEANYEPNTGSLELKCSEVKTSKCSGMSVKTKDLDDVSGISLNAIAENIEMWDISAIGTLTAERFGRVEDVVEFSIFGCAQFWLASVETSLYSAEATIDSHKYKMYYMRTDANFDPENRTKIHTILSVRTDCATTKHVSDWYPSGELKDHFSAWESAFSDLPSPLPDFSEMGVAVDCASDYGACGDMKVEYRLE